MSSQQDAPMFFVRLLKVEPEDFERLYGEIATFFQTDGAALAGCVDAQLFGNEDFTRILIVVQWRSCKAWSRAQWDWRLGQLIEEIVLTTETLEFNLYHGHRFSATVSA